MNALRFVLLLGLASCIEGADDTDLADEDVILEVGGGAADNPGWEPSDTLHANASIYDAVGPNCNDLAGTSSCTGGTRTCP